MFIYFPYKHFSYRNLFQAMGNIIYFLSKALPWSTYGHTKLNVLHMTWQMIFTYLDAEWATVTHVG